MTLQLRIHADGEETARAVAAQLDAWGRESLAARGRCVLSLAGGSTPKAVYRLWGETSRLDWGRVDLLYGDERCVPPDHPDSNHGMVEETLLSQLSRLPRVHWMAGANPDHEQAASDYESVLGEVLGPANGGGVIDVALLGIGEDGHTASLFPRSPALREAGRRCVATRNPAGQARLTLTFPELRRARRRMFLAVGEGKAAILHEVLEGALDGERLPSQILLRDEALETYLYCDRAAVAKLGNAAGIATDSGGPE